VDPQRPLLWFRRLALAGALLAAAVVVLGAWVRLTDAGLGCPDWPGCYGHIYPPKQNFSKALHEMIHRYFASTLGLIVVGLLIYAVRNRKHLKQSVAIVVFLFVLICLQGALGALTVTLLLKPLIVTAHLLGGLTTLGTLWWLSLAPRQGDLSARERSLRPFALGALAALGIQIFLGGWTSTNYAAVACPDLPTCQQSWWPRMDFRDAFVLWRGLPIDYTGGVLPNPARMAIHVTHRLGALLLGSVLMVVGVLTYLRAASARLKVVGALLLGAVLLQIGIGVAMVHFALPLPLATLHNAGAALLVICTVTLLRLLWPNLAKPESAVHPKAAAPQAPAAAGFAGSA
jgi:cytochrome c oxidase assembly protein subunit 15